MIHRDVKPANIFVQPDGKAKLLDFGIARLERRSQDISLTRTGHIIGTVPYMAPERLRDKMIDGRSDIFSVGVVLHQLITGQLPFSGEDYVLMQKILNEPHPPLRDYCSNCPRGLQEIVDNALAKSVDDRYQTAEEMAADLRSVIEELGEEQLVELLPEARRLVEAQDFTRARVVLQQVLKVQSKHTGARELLSEIQRRMVQRQRDERHTQRPRTGRGRPQPQGLRTEPQRAQGRPRSRSQPMPNCSRCGRTVQQEKRKQEQIDVLLRQADSARRKGRSTSSAMASAQEALNVDKTNSKIIALCNMLAAEAEQAKKKAAGESPARVGPPAARCPAIRQGAGAACTRWKSSTPADPEVQLLIGDANAGLEQNRRRDLIVKPGAAGVAGDDPRTASERRRAAIQEAHGRHARGVGAVPPERPGRPAHQGIRQPPTRGRDVSALPRPASPRGAGSGSQRRANAFPTTRSSCRSKP